MLAAQAREEKVALVSLEERFDELGVVRVW
jgi:PIN domain nuclease of toxin-antitoxin system